MLLNLLEAMAISVTRYSQEFSRFWQMIPVCGQKFADKMADWNISIERKKDPPKIFNYFPRCHEPFKTILGGYKWIQKQ